MAVAGWGVGPPILTLLDYLDQYRGALAYDWRSRFGLPLTVPEVVPWDEAWDLTQGLLRDPTSHIAAAVSEWETLFSWEWAAHLNHLDFLALTRWVDGGKKGQRPKPLPRPWEKQKRRLGQGTSMTVAEYRALRARLESVHN